MKRNTNLSIFIGIVLAFCSVLFFLNRPKYQIVKLKTLAELAEENGIIHERTPKVLDKHWRSWKLSNGIVTNDTIAIDIAKAVFKVLSAKDGVQYVPYSVGLSGDSMWVVNGTAVGAFNGGGVYVEIRKQDGCILRIIGMK